ncbi:MAG: nitrilase-related carbon-nitrogen hydrolase [Planctomycetota bacterium]
MKIALCQFDIAWENKVVNHSRVNALLEGASNLTRDALIVLPEMFSTGFSMDVEKNCEGDARVTETFMYETALRFNSYVMGGVINRAPDGRGRNESLTFGPDGNEVARYAKMQPFTLSGELACYAPGDGLKLFDCQGMRVAPFVCYDLRFPELFRHATQLGAQLLVDIANWPVTRIEHWVTLLRARAIENQAYVAGVNRVGNDPKYVHNGRSIIVNPHGEIIADAGNGECVIGAELDPMVVENWRRDFPALKDMRAEYRI